MVQITNLPLSGSWDSAEPETAAHTELSPGLRERFLIIKTEMAKAAGSMEGALHLGCDGQGCSVPGSPRFSFLPHTRHAQQIIYVFQYLLREHRQ